MDMVSEKWTSGTTEVVLGSSKPKVREPRADDSFGCSFVIIFGKDHLLTGGKGFASFSGLRLRRHLI